MALLRADILTSIQYIILIILINMINQQALFIFRNEQHQKSGHVDFVFFGY